MAVGLVNQPVGLGARLAATRRRAFVGRVAERAAFEQLLRRPGAGRVWYVHGPGGVGKTSLLREYVRLAERTGRRLAWVDARDASRDPAHLAGGAAALLGDHGTPTPILFLDGAEALGRLDRWLSEAVLARLPADLVAVIASRDAPPLAWRIDPGWRGLLRAVPLANLSTQDSAELLGRLGVPAPEHGPLLTFTRGHPLALARALQAAVRAAAEMIEASPRDRSVYRVLHHTYLQPAGTQQRAAELLRLPPSTYRRRLAAGVDQLVTILWQHEQDATAGA